MRSKTYLRKAMMMSGRISFNEKIKKAFSGAICLVLCLAVLVLTGCKGKTQNDPAGASTDITGIRGSSEAAAGDGGASNSEDKPNAGKADNGANSSDHEPDAEKDDGEIPADPYDGPCPYTITTMPVVVIYTGSKAISGSKDYTEGWMSLYTRDGSYDVEKLPAGFRLRGNASRSMDKKSYRIKLEEKQNLLGLADGKEKVWTLLANHCDQSLLRNYAAFTLQRGFRAIPWGPNAMNVELYVNGIYKGVYLLAEQIKVSKDRVGISDADIDAVDTGYLVQFSAYAEENVFWIGESMYEVKSDLSEDPDIYEEQMAFIQEYIVKCREALEAGDEEEAERLIDIDSLVAAYLIEEIARNMDSQWDSFFMQKDAGGKLVFGPLWDFDLAFGNDVRAESSQLDSYKYLFVAQGLGSVNGSEETVFELAMENAWFRQRVKDTWNAEYERISKLADIVEEAARTGNDAFNRNFTKWRIFGQRINQEPGEIMQLKSFDAHAEYLVKWIRNRVEWLNKEFNKTDFISLM